MGNAIGLDRLYVWADVLRAINSGERVEIVRALDSGDIVGVEGIARYVADREHGSITHYWTDESVLRVTTIHGWEVFIPLRAILEVS